MNALLVIAKRPAPGQTKTRLTPPLSPEQAARLYEAFLLDTLETVCAVPNVTRLINYAPHDEAAYFAAFAPGFGLVPQVGADLGERLDHALTHTLTQGFHRAVIMDSDSPTLPACHLEQAFNALDHADVVLGPCEDGGYYLIGLKQPAPHLTRGVQMSTPNVLRDTLALAHDCGLTTALLPMWYDVDTVQELNRLQTELHRAAETAAPYTRAALNEMGVFQMSRAGLSLVE